MAVKRFMNNAYMHNGHIHTASGTLEQPTKSDFAETDVLAMYTKRTCHRRKVINGSVSCAKQALNALAGSFCMLFTFLLGSG